MLSLFLDGLLFDNLSSTHQSYCEVSGYPVFAAGEVWVLNDAAMDARVKAMATNVMYDMSRALGHGVGEGKDRYFTADRRSVYSQQESRCRRRLCESSVRGRTS